MARGRHARAYDYYDEQLVTPGAHRPRHRVWCCDTHRALWPFPCPEHGNSTALPRPPLPSAAGGVVSPVVGMPVVGGRTAA